MGQNQFNSIVATTSGMFGGLSKALSSHLVLVNITFQGIIEVAFYAAISAAVGYAVKKAIDRIVKRCNHLK